MHFRVDGIPAPQGSVNAFAIKKGGQYTGRVGIRSASEGHSGWRNAVALAAAEELKRAGLGIGDLPLFPEDTPCTVEMRFYLPRPLEHYRGGRRGGEIKPRYAEAWPLTKDWDKLARTVCDALELAGVVADDKQFVGTHGVWRIYADYCAPGAEIWVERPPPGIPALSLMPGLRRRERLGLGPLVDLATGQILVSNEEE